MEITVPKTFTFTLVEIVAAALVAVVLLTVSNWTLWRLLKATAAAGRQAMECATRSLDDSKAAMALLEKERRKQDEAHRDAFRSGREVERAKSMKTVARLAAEVEFWRLKYKGETGSMIKLVDRLKGFVSADQWKEATQGRDVPEPKPKRIRARVERRAEG